MPNLIKSFMILALILALPAWQILGATPKIKIHIAQIVSHPSLDDVRTGIVDELKHSAYGNQVLFYFHNANGDPKIAAQIAAKVVSEKPAVIVGISTPMSQALVAKKHNTPLVFTVVNDPLGAKLVSSLTHPGGMVTGLRQVSPREELIQLVRKTLPKVKSVGLIFNSGETNSVLEIDGLAAALRKQGITPVVKSVANSSGVQGAMAQILSNKVDAILLTTDNTVTSALGSVLQSAQKQKVPVFASDPNSVKQGAFAGVGQDHTKLGRQTAALVIRILNGEKPGDIPVTEPRGFEVYTHKPAPLPLPRK